ncbi:MAG: cupin domain-containing protein [Acidimicrobiales bacterium]
MSTGFITHVGDGKPAPGAGGSVVAGAGDTDSAFSLLLSHAPAGDGAPLHVHDNESESFLVLAGHYQVRCGERIFEAGVQDFVHLPRGVPHAWQVLGDTAGSKLILAVPGGIEDFFDDLAANTSMEELTHRHGVRFLT